MLQLLDKPWVHETDQVKWVNPGRHIGGLVLCHIDEFKRPPSVEETMDIVRHSLGSKLFPRTEVDVLEFGASDLVPVPSEDVLLEVLLRTSGEVSIFTPILACSMEWRSYSESAWIPPAERSYEEVHLAIRVYQRP